MSTKYQSFPGMEDILPSEIEKWQWIEERARVFFDAAGFKEIRTPILEPTELFIRSIGQSSDIVHKEMFSFKDRGERDMTMRPEMTASVARSVLEHGLLKQAKSLRLYYVGPMFRAERPQAGRKRQFHQIGAEIINESESSDFEIISLLYKFLKYAGLENIQLSLNDLGDDAARAETRAALAKYFGGVKDKLCKDCQWRLEKNVLRVFDCKIPACQPVIDSAPWEKFAAPSEHFTALKKQLSAAGISFIENRRLVRGLDYYTGVVFEITADGLGSQNAVAGGGRYNQLYKEIGGDVTPCTGFSIGFERLLMSIESQNSKAFDILKERKVYFAPLEENAGIDALCQKTALSLREAGARPERANGILSLGQYLKKANQIGARYLLIIGGDELLKKKAVIKDLGKREQVEVDFEQITSHFKKVMNLC